MTKHEHERGRESIPESRQEAGCWRRGAVIWRCVSTNLIMMEKTCCLVNLLTAFPTLPAFLFEPTMNNEASLLTPPLPFPSVTEWKAIIAEFQKPSMNRAVWQLVNTLVPFVALWLGIYFAFSVPGGWW